MLSDADMDAVTTRFLAAEPPRRPLSLWLGHVLPPRRPAPFAWFAWLVPFLVHEQPRASLSLPCRFEVRPDATVRVQRCQPS